MEKIFLELFARSQSRDINGMSPNPFRWWWQFFLVARKKKEHDIFCSRMWMCIFRAQWCTVGMHNAMAQIGHNKSVGSNKMFCSNYFFTFVIMQVVLLNICLRQRWKAVMKSRLRVTPQPQRKEVKWGHVYGRAPLTPPPTPQPHHPSPYLCKINMHGSSKMAWIDAIPTTHYPLLLILRCKELPATKI